MGEARSVESTDLALPVIVEALTAGHEEHRLQELLAAPLPGADAIRDRQAAYAEVTSPALRPRFREFLDGLAAHRALLARISRTTSASQLRFLVLAAVLSYQDAVASLAADLAAAHPSSRELQELADATDRLVSSPDFVERTRRARTLRARLDALRFELCLNGLKVSVLPEDPSDRDVSVDVAATFDRFGAATDADAGSEHLVRFRLEAWVDAVEEGTLGVLARQQPQLFRDLARFTELNAEHTDQRVRDAERWLHLLLSTAALGERLAARGLPFAVPEMLDDARAGMGAQGGYDLALALLDSEERGQLVPNSWELGPRERVLVVTGANQGGKTTFARALGQLHWLAVRGLPVPADSARVAPFSSLHTHFERREEVADARGKLEDELLRIHAILEQTDAQSLVIINEIFGSTTVADAQLLGREVLTRLLATGARGVVVTFLDELAALDPAVVSMVAGVDAQDPARRTFRVTRRPADGMAHALALARRYGLTREQISVRMREARP